jgi:hypothetical protein
LTDPNILPVATNEPMRTPTVLKPCGVRAGSGEPPLNSNACNQKQ